MAKLTWSDIYKKSKKEIILVKNEDKVDGDFVKKLRNDKKLTQKLFAEILGISEKTVEKWEQGKNPIKGTASRLIYILYKYEFLWSEFYREEDDSKSIVNKAELYIVKTEKNNDNLKKERKSRKTEFSYNENKTHGSYNITYENSNMPCSL